MLLSGFSSGKQATFGGLGCHLPTLNSSPPCTIASALTAGDDELYQAQRPLPLAELHDGRGGGVLALLKMALWHALWVEVAPSSGRLLVHFTAKWLQSPVVHCLCSVIRQHCCLLGCCRRLVA